MKLTYVYVLKYAHPNSTSFLYYFGITSNNVWEQILTQISGNGAEMTRKLGVREIVAVYRFDTRDEGEFFKQLLMDKQKYTPLFKLDETENCVHIEVLHLHELCRMMQEDLLRELERMEISSSK